MGFDEHRLRIYSVDFFNPGKRKSVKNVKVAFLRQRCTHFLSMLSSSREVLVVSISRTEWRMERGRSGTRTDWVIVRNMRETFHPNVPPRGISAVKTNLDLFYPLCLSFSLSLCVALLSLPVFPGRTLFQLLFLSLSGFFPVF